MINSKFLIYYIWCIASLIGMYYLVSLVFQTEQTWPILLAWIIVGVINYRIATLFSLKVVDFLLGNLIPLLGFVILIFGNVGGIVGAVIGLTASGVFLIGGGLTFIRLFSKNFH